MVDLMGFFVKD
uniref:Uncharacterized protein n=1 Tax=Lepeophtheirus salmonis TaxID=72036 RepID=A0A0K2SXE1_LEPSM